MRLIRWGVIALALVPLAGCGGDRFGFGGGTTATPAPATPAAPPVDIAGRWTLSSTGGSCAMTFVAGQAAEGAIRPEGGCPGNFFTSRRWSYENNQLIIRDHNSAPLAQLSLSGSGRFEGTSTNGQPVSLSR